MADLKTKPTVRDIADAAGVSLATVDRVLNSRPGVRQITIAKVRDAVERLGYVRDTHAANLARRKQYNFYFVLPEGPNQFASLIVDGLREMDRSQVADRVSIRIVPAPILDPHAVVRTLNALPVGKLDGVAIMVPETPQVRDAVARIKNQGAAVVALVSDLPNTPRDRFIGIDNVAAGRTAAALMGRFLKKTGEILVVTNSLRSRDSLERRLGFDGVMGGGFARHEVLPTVVSHDDPHRLGGIVRESVARRPNLVGVYSMGGGNAALLAALRESGKLTDLVVLAHELTPTTRKALLADEIAALVNQNVGHLVRSAICVLRSVCDGLPILDSQERIRIEILLKENLP